MAWLLLGSLLAWVPGRDVSAVELRWHLTPGQVYRVNVERVVRQNSPAAQWTDETRYLLVWSVQSVDTTGTAEIAQTLAEVRETLRWGDAEPVEYDSTSPREIHGDALSFARHWQPQLNSERRFRLSPLGQWLAAAPVESGLTPDAAPNAVPGANGSPPDQKSPAGGGVSEPGNGATGNAAAGSTTSGGIGAGNAAVGSTTTLTAGLPANVAAAPATATPSAASPSAAVSPAASGNLALPGGVRPIYCVLPAGPLQMGTQWTETHSMPQGDRPDAWQLTTAFTYAGMQEVEDRSLHRIDVECRWRAVPAAVAAGPLAAPNSSLVLERQEGAGQILFDQEAGYMSGSQLSQELITRSRRQDGTTFQSEIVTTVRLRIEPVAPPAAPQPAGVEEVEPPPTVSQPVTPSSSETPR